MWRWKPMKNSTEAPLLPTTHLSPTPPPLPFDLTSKMQSRTVASLGCSFVNTLHQARSVVIHQHCDLHSNIYSSPLCDQRLIKAAPVIVRERQMENTQLNLHTTTGTDST